MNDRSDQTTSIAEQAQSYQAQLDWINAGNRVDRLRRQLEKAQEEYDRCFRRYTGVNLRGETNNGSD